MIMSLSRNIVKMDTKGLPCVHCEPILIELIFFGQIVGREGTNHLH